MNRLFFVALGTVLALTGCASIGRSRDALCANLRQFASTVQPGQTRSVTLRGGWGGDRPETLMTHSCEHSGHEPGKLFCAYLVPNTSWEFGQYNAKRAAACLTAPDKEQFLAALEQFENPAELQGTLAAIAAGSAAGVRLRLEPGRISKLTITVSGGQS